MFAVPKNKDLNFPKKYKFTMYAKKDRTIIRKIRKMFSINI